MMIIAVDFDGTLSMGKWPEIGSANNDLINYLKERKMYGDKIILWTCRSGKQLEDAVSWCMEHDLYFDAVNDNLPEIKEMYGNNSRKISCDIYIDDKAVNASNFRNEKLIRDGFFDFDYVSFKLVNFAENLIK